MTSVPSHVASAISRTVLQVVKLNTVEPKTTEEKDVVIEAVTGAQREVHEAYGQDGSDFFIVTLAVMSGMGYVVAGKTTGIGAGELLDQIYVSVESSLIDGREFPKA